MKLKATILFFLLLTPFIKFPIAKADPGWLAEWDYRVQITIDSDDIDAELTHFPVLIKLSNSSGVNGTDVTFVFDEVGANSLKIAVTKDDGITELYVEIEDWDHVTEKAYLWVSKSDWVISNVEDTIIYLYYDKDHADNNAHVGVVSSAPGELVWDISFICVLHMSEDSGNFLDSTSNDNDGSAQGTVTRGIERINGGINIAGTDDFIRIETAGIDSNKDELTVEIWAKGNVVYGIDKALTGDWAGGGNEVYLLYFDRSPINRWRMLFEDDGGGTRDVVFGDTPPTVNTWYHIASTYKRDDRVYGYQNGIQTAGDVTPDIQLESTTSKIAIGQESDTGAKDFNGRLDEYRLSTISRNSAWIKASYETGRDELIGFGEEEERPLVEPPNKLFGAGFNGSIAYVDLRWFSNLTDINFFEVQNSTDKIAWDYLGTSTTNNYTDLEVVNGTERYYRVRACNFTGAAWDNSSFTDINFETVYYEVGGTPGPGPIGGLFPGLAIGISLLIIGAILALEKRR